MPEISVLLPSLRKEAAAQRIREFARTHECVDYEIILVSPFAIPEPRVVHIPEEKPKGGIHALNAAYQRASASYITWWSDDAWPTSNCLKKMLKFIKEKQEPFLGGFRLRNRHGDELEPWSVYGRLYACWGMASQNTLRSIGGFLDPRFKRFWSDPDMSLRAWTRGGRVELCPDAWVVICHIEDGIKQNDLKKYFAEDTETFFDRWHDRLGEGKPRVWTEINRPIPVRRRPTLRFMIGAVTNRVPFVKQAKEMVKTVIGKK